MVRVDLPAVVDHPLHHRRGETPAVLVEVGDGQVERADPAVPARIGVARVYWLANPSSNRTTIRTRRQRRSVPVVPHLLQGDDVVAVARQPCHLGREHRWRDVEVRGVSSAGAMITWYIRTRRYRARCVATNGWSQRSRASEASAMHTLVPSPPSKRSSGVSRAVGVLEPGSAVIASRPVPAFSRSSPVSPRSWSSPSPPPSRSRPSAPAIVSFPGPPWIVSFPAPPEMQSFPSPPDHIVAAESADHVRSDGAGELVRAVRACDRAAAARGGLGGTGGRSAVTSSAGRQGRATRRIVVRDIALLLRTAGGHCASEVAKRRQPLRHAALMWRRPRGGGWRQRVAVGLVAGERRAGRGRRPFHCRRRRPCRACHGKRSRSCGRPTTSSSRASRSREPAREGRPRPSRCRTIR